MFFLERISSFLYWSLRPLIKWFLRRTTRLCELQRICYGYQSGFERSNGVEFSLRHSRSVQIRELIAHLDDVTRSAEFTGSKKAALISQALRIVTSVKRINLEVHRTFLQSFGRCVETIWGYRQLYEEVESLRTIQFDSENPAHEEKLLRLWSLLKPGVELEARVTKQWQDIGFQGDDPKTDFRGMGLLGLENLLFFANEYSSAASHVLSHSQHPKYGYAFAVVGINITSMAYHLLKDESAKSHFYNSSRFTPPSLRFFHQFYCYLFYEFDIFWVESKPKDIMEFTFIRDKFENSIRSKLESPDVIFRLNYFVDTV